MNSINDFGRSIKHAATPAKQEWSDTSSMSGEDDDDDRSYTVERILHERPTGRGLEYLVKWSGYSDYRSTYELEQNFDNEETLQEWRKQRKAGLFMLS